MDTIPPIDPDLETILAKSTPESLVEHTWRVLSRLSDQLRLRPNLAAEVNAPRLWHWMYWGTFLHDFGKAADGFQAVLQGKAPSWGFRHEALSLAFVDWLFPDGHPDRIYVIAVIACHHRDAEVITNTYRRNRTNPDEDSATKLVGQVSEVNCRRLYRWLTEYSRDWAEQLGFAPYIDFPIPQPLKPLEPSAIHRAIMELKNYVDSLGFSEDAPNALIGTLLRGLILTSDHAGSAHSDVFLSAALERDTVTSGLQQLFPHQIEADQAPVGSTLLISPTSSGKTEAALLWLARQQAYDGLASPRVFYLLPYQASMNAAHQRLKRIFNPETVGLQHSRMAQALFASALANHLDNDTAAIYAYQQKALTKLLSFPVTVMSPYQLLKIPYQLKGFESLLTNFYGGRFILDEIHAYEPKRLALFIAVVTFLHRHCHARFFIMTATLPPQVREKLCVAIPDLHIIEANTETFRQFQRHRVHLLSGELLSPEIVRRITDAATDKSILICCNTVRRAREVHAAIEVAIRQRYGDSDDFEIILLHSRFNAEDRAKKEAAIMRRTGVTSTERGRTIVVATQVVEVSLNIDLDTLYTEAAPLEALIQRFGRVNRGRPASSDPADVYVLREQPENVKHIYSQDLVNAALACLEEADGMPVDESRVSQWLAQIYVGKALEHWQAEYETSWDQFQSEVMSSLRPFKASDLDHLFFQMFDSVDVLPESHLNHYEGLLRKGRYLEAANLLVSIAWRDYKRLEKMRHAWHEKKKHGDVHVVSVPYSSESGLDLYSVYTTGSANDLPTTDLDFYNVPPEAD